MNEDFDLKYFACNGICKSNPLLNLGSGDSSLYLDALSPELTQDLFGKLDQEIQWNVMTHKGGPVPRLVSIQAARERDDSLPLYRHPADEQPATVEFSYTVLRCRDEISALLGQPLNHVLIQKYRSGKDNISEHADKTLDIARGTVIVNLSVGSTRVMKLKSKPDHPSASTDKIIQRITLPPNSVFVLGWETNKLFTHEIKADKRPACEKRPDERLCDEQRISMTFRTIATYITPSGVVFGQGATRKLPSVDYAVEKSTNSDPETAARESQRLLAAFSIENRSALYDWDELYGEGSDVVNFSILNSTVQTS
jgi:alkylated DNA repair dioxygenase AlkB